MDQRGRRGSFEVDGFDDGADLLHSDVLVLFDVETLLVAERNKRFKLFFAC